MPSNEQAGRQLGEFYREWNRQTELVRDRSLPRGERLAALRWLDEHIGGGPTPPEELDNVTADLDAVAAELSAE